MKTIALPKSLTPNECELEIENNLSDYLPALTEKMVFDFVFKKNNDALQHHLWFVAAKSEQMMLFKNLLHQSGFILKAIDVGIFSLARCLHLLTAKEQGVFALIDCREENFTLIVIQEKALIFYETVDFLNQVHPIEMTLVIYKTYARCLSVNHTLQVKKIILSGQGDLVEVSNLLKMHLNRELVIFSQLFDQHFPGDLINRSATALGLALWRQYD